MQSFQILLNLQCSPDLRFFLCSLFVPMCSEHVSEPILACRSHCLQVRKDCEPVLQSLSMHWPSELQCDQFPDPSDPTKLCMLRRDDEDYKMLPYLPNQENNDRFGNTGSNSIYSTECFNKNLLDSSQRLFLEKWSTSWGWLCFISTLFTLLTWTVEPTRYRYPERPVLFIALCYLVYSVVYVLQGALGTPEHAGPCLVSAVTLYYSNLAASAWWTAFVLSWWLSAARDWSTEALSIRMAPRLHLVCWGGPFIVTGGVFWGHLSTVDVPCELQRPFATLIPHTILIIVIIILSLFTAQALIQVRKTLISSGRSANKLERLMTRLSLYILLYLIPTVGWLITTLWSYSSGNTDDNNITATNIENCDTLSLELVITKIFLSLLVGILSGMWVWSAKTCKAWRKVFGVTPPEKQRRAMPISRV
ncbi:frizzled-4-like isoform X2 [Chrysoperla carnea]|nr:frizzled-4-like isoform X2 [Chrysoperla carnea]XP_044738510.1 frizzled-4-like isoform X2 [Chrysoperla carnea]